MLPNSIKAFLLLPAIVIYMYSIIIGSVELHNSLNELHYARIDLSSTVELLSKYSGRDFSDLQDSFLQKKAEFNELFSKFDDSDTYEIVELLKNKYPTAQLEWSDAESDSLHLEAIEMRVSHRVEYRNAIKMLGFVETNSFAVKLIEASLSDYNYDNKTVLVQFRLIVYLKNTTSKIKVLQPQDFVKRLLTLSMPQRKMNYSAVKKMTEQLANPFHKQGLPNLTLKEILPLDNNQFSVLLQKSSGKSFSLVPGETFEGITLKQASEAGCILYFKGVDISLNL